MDDARAVSSEGRVRARGGRAGELITLAVIVGVGVVALVALSGWSDLSCGDGSIVDLEFAGSASRSEEVLAGHDGDACSAGDVRSALVGDFALIAVYATLLAYLAWKCGPIGYRIKPLRRGRKVLVAAAIAAAGFDVIENVLLLAGLRDDPVRITTWFAIFATVAAWAKWLALAAAALYVIGALAGVLATPMWYRAVIEEADERAALTDHRKSDEVPSGGDQSPVDGAVTASAAAKVIERPGWQHGVCLSGGGVRSAVFGLGALQRLEAQPEPHGGAAGAPLVRWSSAERVTAVSGGAYMAGAWSIANRDPASRPTPRPWLPGSPEIDYFREHLGYLLRSDPGEDKSTTAKKPGVFAVLFFGLALNVAVLATLLLILARPLGWLASAPWIQPNLRLPYDSEMRVFELTTAQRWTVVTFVALTVAFLGMWVLAGRLLSVANGAFWRGVSNKVHTGFRAVVTASAAVTAAVLLLLVVLPWLMFEIPALIGRGEGNARSGLAKLIGLASGAGVFAAAFRLVRNPLSKIAPRLGGLLLAVLVVVLGSVWASDAALDGLDTSIDAPWDSEFVAWLTLTAVWLLWYSVANPEWWSMAPFYRSRLRSVYALRRVDGKAEPYQNNPDSDDEREPSFHELTASGVPTLQLCAATTVSDRSVRTHYGIPAHSFTFTRDRVRVHVPLSEEGRSEEVACPTAYIEKLWHRRGNPRLTTIAAVAMSGAAISPAMGRHSLGSTDSLLTLANIRLGVWLPNPRYARLLDQAPPSAPYPRVRINYLLKELFGIFDPTDHYVYVTDGGHWENAGLVELVRHEPLDEIFCLDGSGVSVSSLATLAEAISLAPLECGANIKIRFEPMRATATGTRGGGYSQRTATLGVVKYPEDPGKPTKISLLWYAKPVLTAEAQTRILAYREHDDRFPAHGTQDQFFDAEQFEGYRTLGDDAMVGILAARTALWNAVADFDDLAAMRRKAADDDDAHWVLDELPRIIDDDEYAVLRAALMRTNE